MDMPAEVMKAIEDVGAKACDQYLGALEQWYAQELARDELPTEQGEYVLVGQDEHPMGLIELVKALGYEDFSPQYYRAHVLTLASAVRYLRSQGQVDAAILAAKELGELLAEEEYHESSQAGYRTWEAGRKAAAATWGSPQKRLAEKEKLLRLFNQVRPQLARDADAYDAVAASTGVSWRKVRRAVTGH